MTVRCLGIPNQFANYLEKNPSKHLNQKFIDQANKNKIDSKFIEYIQTNFVAFGPKKVGPNLLLIEKID